MTDNNYPLEDGQLFDYSELIEGLATVTNIEKSNYLELSDAPLNKQAIEDLFDLLLDLVLIQPSTVRVIKKLHPSQKISSLWDAIAPTLRMKCSLIGVIFFLFAAVIAALLKPIATLPILIYLVICFCFLVLFVVLRSVNEIEPFKNQEKELKADLKKARDESVLFDLPMAHKIVETANYQPEVLRYVENRLQVEIEKQQDSIKLTYKFWRIGIVCIFAIVVYNFVSSQILLSTVFSGNTTVISAILTVSSSVVAGMVLILEFGIESRLKLKITSYKMCLYYLQQAQLLLVSNE